MLRIHTFSLVSSSNKIDISLDETEWPNQKTFRLPFCFRLPLSEIVGFELIGSNTSGRVKAMTSNVIHAISYPWNLLAYRKDWLAPCQDDVSEWMLRS